MTNCLRAAAHQPLEAKLSLAALSQTRKLRVLPVLTAGLIIAALTGCGGTAPVPSESKTEAMAEAKPATPAIPDEIQGAAKTLLGSEVTVLVFGDLAKNGNQQFLAANVVPKTPTNNIPGTVATRVVIAEKEDGKWTELLHVDEHLKNQKGFLALTPLEAITGWRVQFEQNPVQGLLLYFTPVKASDPHVLTIGVRWNPKVKRYQSMDHAFEKFLPEATQLGETPRSSLR